MRIDITIDPTALKARTDREVKNLAYSTSQALNAVAKDIQTQQRVHLDQTYHLRKAGFMYRLIKIFRFSNARQGIPYAEVGVDTSKNRVLLSTFEAGGERRPFTGKHVAVPITGGAARPSESALVKGGFTFEAMALERHVTRDGKVQWKGKSGTFLLPNIGVFQRQGRRNKRGKGRRVALIYKLIAPGAMKHLPANLRFLETARHQVQQKFTDYFARYFRKP